MTMNKNAPILPRVAMLDIARFYGMVLVYYGHIVERVMYLQNPAATLDYKFIYSFHMPFFFLLSGFVAKPEYAQQPWGRCLKRLAASRLVPYVVFSLLLACTTLFWKGHFVAVDLSTLAGYVKGLVATAMGFPAFNIPLWFLACLVSVEVAHRALAPLARTDKGLLLTALVCYAGGYWLNSEYCFLLEGMNFWFINEVPVVYSFYLVGVLMRRRGILLGRITRRKALLWGLGCMALVFFTYNLNHGPFRLIQAVVIVFGAHGNFWLFPLTALAGSLGLLLLAKASGASALLQYMGRNVIIFFCLNGVFYHYFNGPFAEWYVAGFSGSGLSVFLVCSAMTVVSMAACLPALWFFNRYFPQLVGRPRVQGPILPRLLRQDVAPAPFAGTSLCKE